MRSFLLTIWALNGWFSSRLFFSSNTRFNKQNSQIGGFLNFSISPETYSCRGNVTCHKKVKGLISSVLSFIEYRGYNLKPKHFRSWSRPIRVLSDVPVSRKWYKNVSNLYESLCNIHPYHVIRTPTNGSAVYWSCDRDGDKWQ